MYVFDFSYDIVGPGSLPVAGKKQVVESAINKAVGSVKTSPTGRSVQKVFYSLSTLDSFN